MVAKVKVDRAQQAWLDTLKRNHGATAFDLGGDVAPYEVVSTGSLTLDHAVGVGGLVEGRIAEYWGPDGIGKTTFALMAVAEAQRKHPTKVAAYIDMEHKLDKPWAAAHGVDLARLLVFTPDTAEDVADAMKDMLEGGHCSMVVLDSVGAMIPKVEVEKDAGEATMGTNAKIVTRMVKIAAGKAAKAGTAVIIINQVRANLSYGADTTTGGGFALKHVSTMKFKFKRTGTRPFTVKIGGDDVIVGHEIAILVERNGVAPAYKTAIVTLFNQATAKYGPMGVDKADEAATLGLRLGIIGQSGGWYTLPTGERVNGRDKMVAALRADPALVEQVRTEALAAVAEDVIPDTEPPTGEPEPEDTTPKKPAFRTSGSIEANE